MAKEAESYVKRADRAGKKGMVMYLDRDVARRLKIAGATFELTLQQIGEKAIGEWLEEHGFPAQAAPRSALLAKYNSLEEQLDAEDPEGKWHWKADTAQTPAKTKK